jgi:precorrin-6Y C5,15-methyltransferase (decarboxylating)
MPRLLVAGCNGTSIDDEILVLLADPRYPLFSSPALREVVVSLIPQFDATRWSSIVPLDDCFAMLEKYRDAPGIIILTSGDPLFYGLGKRLQKRFSDWQISYFPAVSYMQSCFAHFGIHWDDAHFLSLHGRPLANIEQKLYCPKLFIFTDPQNTPDKVADYLRERLSASQAEARRIFVGEGIGSDNEKFSEGTIEETCARTYGQPNSMIVIDQGFEKGDETTRFGLTEEEIEHSRGLITKSEIRAAVLHRLRLPESGIFWDVGAGSGSISLEASRLSPSLSVYAVEKKEEELANILANVTRYQCRNVVIVPGEAPEVLGQLPAPDCVFIGGSGGRLEDILEFLATAVRDETPIVMTAVLAKTARQAPEILNRHNFIVDISTIEVTRHAYPETTRLELNPIHIIRAVRTDT